MDIIAIYPGTFDPITHGHVDIARRASHLFEKVILAIAESVVKNPLFSLDERVMMAQLALAGLKNVEIMGFSGLMVAFAEQQNANVIVRGLRAVSDFDYEVQLAAVNRKLKPSIETVYMSPEEEYSFISSSFVRDVALHGGDVSQFVHPAVEKSLIKKFKI